MSNTAAVYKTDYIFGAEESLFPASYALLGLAVVMVIPAVVFYIVSGGHSLLVGVFGALSVLSLIAGFILGMIGGVFESRHEKREKTAKQAWLLATYPGVVSSQDANMLASGRKVYLNDNGSTRDEVQFVYNNQLEGQTLQFTTVNTPQLLPVPSAV